VPIVSAHFRSLLKYYVNDIAESMTTREALNVKSSHAVSSGEVTVDELEVGQVRHSSSDLNAEADELLHGRLLQCQHTHTHTHTHIHTGSGVVMDNSKSGRRLKIDITCKEKQRRFLTIIHTNL